MFPFTIGGEVPLPQHVSGHLDAAGAAAGVAEYLRAAGAADVAVVGGEVTFRVPMLLGWRAAAGTRSLHPVDAGVVRVRDGAGSLVLSYRLRLRRALSLGAILVAAGVAFGSGDLAWRMGCLLAASGMALWLVFAMGHRYPRVFADGIARAAGAFRRPHPGIPPPRQP